MSPHPWLAPTAATVAKVRRARATALLRKLAILPANRLGGREAAWPPLLAALPLLLRTDATTLLDAVGRVDVSSALADLAHGRVDARRVERALIAFWLAIAGHPGLTSPLALPGPFRECVVDPRAPRLLAFGDVRGLIATARGTVVIGHAGRSSIEAFVDGALPAGEGTVIVDEQLRPPPAAVVERVRAALALVGSAIPGGELERVTIAAGDAEIGEARVGSDGDPADLVYSAQSAFVRAAAALDPPFAEGGALLEKGLRLAPVDVLARACGAVAALPWRTARAHALSAIENDLDDLAVVAEPTPLGAELLVTLRRAVGGTAPVPPRALLVNVDPDDFVYSFQFGRSVERRCVERALRVDRIAIDTTTTRDLAAELGTAAPPSPADGTEVLVQSREDPSLPSALRRFSSHRYALVVANVRPALFYDLMAAGLLSVPTLLWDRHLHGGLRAEGQRRGIDPQDVRRLPLRAWSLTQSVREGVLPSLSEAGVADGAGHPWPIDLAFAQSTAVPHPARLFAGGDNGRDWPLFLEAIRDLPLDVHLVTANPPSPRPHNVRADARLPLWRFRDAMAAATVTAIPLVPDMAAGVTVLALAMALGVAVVATRTPWTEQYVADGNEALLVPPGDINAFRDAIVRLYEDNDLRTRLTTNARRRVAQYDLEELTRAMFAPQMNTDEQG